MALSITERDRRGKTEKKVITSGDANYRWSPSFEAIPTIKVVSDDLKLRELRDVAGTNALLRQGKVKLDRATITPFENNGSNIRARFEAYLSPVASEKIGPGLHLDLSLPIGAKITLSEKNKRNPNKLTRQRSTIRVIE